MDSIDLYDDFNEELDARAGDEDDIPGGSDQDDGPRDPADGDDENKEAVDAKVKVVRVKRKLVTLNVERLKGSRGIVAIDDFFKNMNFRGKGYEKQDLDDVMKRLEHWAHRMFPKYNFEDSLAAIDRIAKKREFQIHMDRYRRDQLTTDDAPVISDDEENRENPQNDYEDQPMDEFEALINEQIALTTVHQSRNPADNTTERSFGNLSSIHQSTSQHNISGIQPNMSFDQSQSQPTVSQQPLSSTQIEISDEVKARIAENKKRALALLEQRKKEAEEKKQKEDSQNQLLKGTEISNIFIDDDDY